MKWEYKILKFQPSFWLGNIKDEEIQKELNLYGDQGWELCGTFDINTNVNGRTSEIVFTLKRVKS